MKKPEGVTVYIENVSMNVMKADNTLVCGWVKGLAFSLSDLAARDAAIRAEALEIMQRGIDLFNTLNRQPLTAGDVWLVQHASKAWIEEVRALKEKA